MKKIICCILVLMMLFIASCSKPAALEEILI